MRAIHKRLLGLAAIAYAIYLLFDVFGNPDGLGPVFRDWTSSPTEQPAAQPAAPVSDVPSPTNPLNR